MIEADRFLECWLSEFKSCRCPFCASQLFVLVDRDDSVLGIEDRATFFVLAAMQKRFGFAVSFVNG